MSNPTLAESGKKACAQRLTPYKLNFNTALFSKVLEGKSEEAAYMTPHLPPALPFNPDGRNTNHVHTI